MRLVIIGAGFAGMYAALSAARLREIQGVSPEELEIALVAPEPTLVVRPRLYEPKPETLTAPLLDVLRAIDVVYVQGSAETIDSKIPHGRQHRRQGYEEEPLLRSAGRGHRQPAVPSEHSRPRRARI
jgi:2-polyprenyl-6-methoxyphenol hydroxylase-like FAD-dependent oxidoreductase